MSIIRSKGPNKVTPRTLRKELLPPCPLADRKSDITELAMAACGVAGAEMDTSKAQQAVDDCYNCDNNICSSSTDIRPKIATIAHAISGPDEPEAA